MNNTYNTRRIWQIAGNLINPRRSGWEPLLYWTKGHNERRLLSPFDTFIMRGEKVQPLLSLHFISQIWINFSLTTFICLLYNSFSTTFNSRKHNWLRPYLRTVDVHGVCFVDLYQCFFLQQLWVLVNQDSNHFLHQHEHYIFVWFTTI